MSTRRIRESLLIAAAVWLGVLPAHAQTCCGDISGGECGVCCNGSQSGGCNDAECCELVCELHPQCCTNGWGDLCFIYAQQLCPICGAAPSCGDFGMGDCCSAHSNPYCNKKSCCEAVCDIDPSCCDVEWTQCCADLALSLDDVCTHSQCMDSCQGMCGACSANCCCDVACVFFNDCCDDAGAFCGSCAGHCGGQSPDGCFCDDACFFFSDCCTDVCNACPGTGECITYNCPGVILSASPLSGTLDARQPYPPAGGPLSGIGGDGEHIYLTLSEPGDGWPCLSVCETKDDGTCAPNIPFASWAGEWTLEISLTHAVTPGAVTRIYYGPPEDGDYVEYISHPGNVNGDAVAGAGDVLFLVDILNGVKTAPFGLYSSDIDRSGVVGPPDVLRLIDLLNGAQAYKPWNLTPLPTNEGVCP